MLSFFRGFVDGQLISFSKTGGCQIVPLPVHRLVYPIGQLVIQVAAADDLRVYFMEIDFSADIPTPGQWYTSAAWPKLRIMDGMVTVNR
jgi:hypothetical protein